MLLIIDNYDSFTWNLFQYFCELNMDVQVVRNDKITLRQLRQLPLTHLVISPGPGRPEQAGVSLAAIHYFSGKLPILGVCLGHQALAQAYGGNIVRAREIVHGKTTVIQHDGSGVFSGLNKSLRVTRYHSLVVEAQSLHPDFAISAWSMRDGKLDEIMAIRHRYLALQGVQFHPESIMSEQGHKLLANFCHASS